MREIQLSRGKIAIVDEADYDELSRFSWCVDHQLRSLQDRTIPTVRSPPAKCLKILVGELGFEPR